MPPILRAAIQEQEEATRQSSLVAPVDAVEPDDSTSAATVRRLAGAIKTNPEGTEAGIVIAPFVLAGSSQLRGLELTLAALEGDFTRTGASYTWDLSPTFDDVWRQPDACPATEPRLRALEQPRDFYLNTCTHLVAALPDALPSGHGLSRDEEARYLTALQRSRLACGLPAIDSDSRQVQSLPEAINLLTTVIGISNEVVASTDALPPGAALYALSLRSDALELANWTIPGPTACYDADGIRAYIQKLFWTRAKRKFALSANWDLFPRKYGFSPDDSPLPGGDVRTAEARVDFSYARGATEVSFGVGLGRARSELLGSLSSYVGPSISLARAFSLISSKPLTTSTGELNVEDGDMPPRLVVGLTFGSQITLDKPTSQDTRFNSLKIQPHVDFLISETLSFRLGIPLKAEIVERQAKDAEPATPTTPEVPGVPARRSLQWTVPVAIIAVIKL